MADTNQNLYKIVPLYSSQNMIKFILSVSFILPDINKQYLPTRRQTFSFFLSFNTYNQQQAQKFW